MIKIEITDVEELKNLQIVDSYELKEYLEQTYPSLMKEALNLSWGTYGDVEEILQYISSKVNLDHIHEVCMPLGADITATYGYIID